MKTKLSKKNCRIILYVVNTIVCLYCTIMFIITDGKDIISELLFQFLFVIDAIIIYRNKKYKG